MPNIQLQYGPMLVGVFMNMILYGVLLMQTYVYYQTYKKDGPWLRYFVLYLFLVETMNTGFDMAMMYEPLIAQYATPQATTFFPIMFATEPIMIVAVSTPIQIFLAWRIRLITKSNWIPAIIAVLSIVALAGGIWTTVMIAIIRRFALKPLLHWPALVWFIASCIADVLITISLVRSLSQKKTGITATDDVLNRIIRLTVQTGMITAIAAIGDVVFFMVLPHTALNFLWDLALSKLYTNSLMSTLNARAAWNNIASGQSNGNVLFAGSGSRRLPENFNNTTTFGNSGFELETQKSFRESKSPRELEFGIEVTTIVERLQDPVPSAL